MRLKRNTLRASAVASLLMVLPAMAEPYRPADDDAIVGRLPSHSTMSVDKQRAWRESTRKRPNDPQLAAAAARAYLREARATADPRFEGYAEAALAPWWLDKDAPVDILLLKASLRERRHDFDGALADLDAALRRETNNGQALLARASILQVRGEFEASLDACTRLPTTVTNLVRAACIAGARGLLTGGDDALAGLLDALRRDRQSGPDVRAYAFSVYGDVALARGRGDLAEDAFRRGLRIDPQDGYLLAGFADFLLDSQRNAEVLTLISANARDVSLSLRRFRALPPEDAEADEIRARAEAIFGAARKRGDPPHHRVEAYHRLFVTGEPELALEHARINFVTQREPFDARLVLEAALASGQNGAAAEVIEWLDDAGVEHHQLDRLVARLQDIRLCPCCAHCLSLLR